MKNNFRTLTSGILTKASMLFPKKEEVYTKNETYSKDEVDTLPPIEHEHSYLQYREYQACTPTYADWKSVTYGNGKFVAVANSTTAAYSEDGINWTQTTLPIDDVWQSVTYGNGKFVAVANSTTAAYSEDGINWTQTTLPIKADWHSVTYGNGKFVAIGYNNTVAAYSEDGINWTQTTLPIGDKWYSVTYGNGKFVAVAYSSTTAAYSYDGINWTQTTLPASALWRSVTYGNGKFVAVAYSTTTAAYSEDGINWTESTLPSSDHWYSVTYGNGKFVAVAYESNKAAYSYDGITWYDTYDEFTQDGELIDIATKPYVDRSIPTSLSQLTNDAGFITADDIPAGSGSWNDLTDRPFGEEVDAFEPIVWDGNIDGFETAKLLGDTVYRIDRPTTIEHFLDGATVVACAINKTLEGQLVDRTADVAEMLNQDYGVSLPDGASVFGYSMMHPVDNNGYEDFANGLLWVVTKENAYLPIGVWYYQNYNGYEHSLTISKIIEKPLDEKYLPYSVATKTYVDEVIPTSVSQLTNDAGYITAEDLPTIPGGSGGSVASGGSIIDVIELPTENIREDVWYRLLTAKLFTYGYAPEDWSCHCVNGLPEVGEAFTTNMNYFIVYYNTQDGTVSAYADAALATQYGLTAGWYPIDMVMQLGESTWGGIITDISDLDPNDGAFRLLLTYDFYTYKNEWVKTVLASEKAPKYNITWDGDMTGRPALDMSMLGYDPGLYFVKVSDDVFTTDELIGWHYTGRGYDGENLGDEIYSNDIDTQTYPGAISISNAIVIVYDDELLATALGIPTGIYTNGIYFWLRTDPTDPASGGYVSNLTSPARITKIASEYLDTSIVEDMIEEALQSAIYGAIGGSY